MVYLFGVSGFALGFLAGLFIIQMFLRSYSARQLVNDKSLRWTYGIAVWLMAGLGAWLGVWVYERSVF
jgi:hypothetical protein